MSFSLHGIPVSGGIAIGHAHLISHAKLEAAHYLVPPDQLPAEVARFDAAVESVRAELAALRRNVPATAPAEFVGFIDVHLMILNDSMLSVEPRDIIETEQCNAEWALKVQMDALLAQFDEIEDSYLRERRTDVIQVVERVMKALLGHPGYAPPQTDGGRSLVEILRLLERSAEDRSAVLIILGEGGWLRTRRPEARPWCRGARSAPPPRCPPPGGCGGGRLSRLRIPGGRSRRGRG